MVRAQTIQIFLPSGNPQGLRQAEITTRTVQVFDVPRSVLGDFLKQDQAHQVGLYFLFGEVGDADDRVQCYIGESDDVGVRLKGHDRTKEFWDRALVAVSLTNTWTKAHVRYMEAKALQVGRDAGRYALANGNEGFTTAYTPKPLQADCDEFFDTVSVLTATLGFPVLRPMQSKQDTKPDQMLHLRGMDDITSGTYSTDGLTVFRGSRLVVTHPDPHGSGTTLLANPRYEPIERQRAELIEEGVLGWEDGQLVFLRDHAFTSPSGAACLIRGRSQNGWIEWRDGAKRTLDSLERVAVDRQEAIAPHPDDRQD